MMLNQHKPEQKYSESGDAAKPATFYKEFESQHEKGGSVNSEDNAGSDEKYKMHVYRLLFFVSGLCVNAKPKQNSGVNRVVGHLTNLFNILNTTTTRVSCLYEKEITYG